MQRSTKIIKIRMLELGLRLEQLAQEFGCRKSELSMCINCAPYRTYPALRRKLAMRLGLNYERTWGKPKQSASNRRRQQQLRAA